MEQIKVIELFAGVGGFRLALEGHPDSRWGIPYNSNFKTVWMSQWEPGRKNQFAFDCYNMRFQGNAINEYSNVDIKEALNAAEKGKWELPACDLLVGGFPCQDYSVARTLSSAGGIEGKKGVLWWEIIRTIDFAQPKYLLFENVDRLLKSPAAQRGRDFAIILSCLQARGYNVEWRVINAAEYGFAQKRKRIYVFAERTENDWNPESHLLQDGILAKSFACTFSLKKKPISFQIDDDILNISENFGTGSKTSIFLNAGIMSKGSVYTAQVDSSYSGPYTFLQDVLSPIEDVPEAYYIPDGKVKNWMYLKGAKKEKRITKEGFEYNYSEGSMSFPDALDKPARTILTGEGGTSASRFKHAILSKDGRYRRLLPDELDQLQGFPKGWTDTGMSDGNRAFCMGNALVVQLPAMIAKTLTDSIEAKRE